MRTLVISIDAELGWGFHDLADPPADRLENGRSGWLTLIDLLDTYNLPATWAIVGHLFLSDCDGFHSQHPLGSEWFEREHSSWITRPDLRFGRDLIDDIVASPVEHEIGCHTFSHVEFGADYTTQDVARAEVIESIRAAQSYETPFESFVFPRNNIGHRDILAEWGFSCYRGTQPRSYGLSRAGRIAEKIVHSTISAPPVVTPTIDEYGLVNIPASLFLFTIDNRPRDVANAIWNDPIVTQVDRGIKNLIEGEEGVFHIWLHPNNIRDHRDVDRMDAIFDLISTARSKHELTVKTMGQVAAEYHTQNNPQPPTQVDRR